jgi:hypothetical protein
MSMTPEDFQQLKALKEKLKEHKEGLTENKASLFQDIMEEFGSEIASCGKSVITISTKEAMADGYVWSISLGLKEEGEKGDAEKVAKKIMEKFNERAEEIMAMNDSGKVEGTFEGNEAYLQLRRREATETE